MDLLRYERRILGGRASAPALAILLGSAAVAFGIVLLTAHNNRTTVADFLTAGLEMLLPLSAGILCAMLPAQDGCLELQLTMPTSYARTTLRRWGLVSGWTALCAWVGASLLYAGQLWRVPIQLQDWSAVGRYLGEQLVWLAPLLWLAAVGLGVTLLVRSAVASVAMLGGTWIIETFAASFFTSAWLHPVFLFPTTFTPFAHFWLANRVELSATGLLLLPICWRLLGNREALLRTHASETAG
jgi:hypothetical protein